MEQHGIPSFATLKESIHLGRKKHQPARYRIVLDASGYISMLVNRNQRSRRYPRRGRYEQSGVSAGLGASRITRAFIEWDHSSTVQIQR